MDPIQEFGYIVSYYDAMNALESWSPGAGSFDIKKFFKTIFRTVVDAFIQFFSQIGAAIQAMIGKVKSIKFGRKRATDGQGKTDDDADIKAIKDTLGDISARSITREEYDCLVEITTLVGEASKLAHNEAVHYVNLITEYYKAQTDADITDVERLKTQWIKDGTSQLDSIKAKRNTIRVPEGGSHDSGNMVSEQHVQSRILNPLNHVAGRIQKTSTYLKTQLKDYSSESVGQFMNKYGLKRADENSRASLARTVQGSVNQFGKYAVNTVQAATEVSKWASDTCARVISNANSNAKAA